MSRVKTVTAQVRITRWCGGVGAGVHGIACYEFRDGDGEQTNQMTGVSLENLLGRELGDGAVCEVVVRVKREGRTKWNPWLNRDGTRKY